MKKQKKHNNVFLSLSVVINSKSPNHVSLIKECSPERLLVESDYNDVDLCTRQTWDMLRIVAETKGWPLEETWDEEVDIVSWGAVRKLEDNWRRFCAGNHPVVDARGEKKKKGGR